MTPECDRNILKFVITLINIAFLPSMHSAYITERYIFFSHVSDHLCVTMISDLLKTFYLSIESLFNEHCRQLICGLLYSVSRIMEFQILFLHCLAENNIICLLIVKYSDTTQDSSVAYTLQKYDIT
jgi:hypothetical protein